jgi:hypothetical protein
MAAETVTFTDRWSTKIRANDGPWGTIGAWRDWVKAETKRAEANHRLRIVEAEQAAALEAARASVLTEASTD